LLKGKKVLITGGTGTLGRALTRKLLMMDVDTIRVFSRDEGKQLDMSSHLNDERIRYIIGDVRDNERINYAMEDIDIVLHVAALKQVPVAEYNPFEAVKTNVLGSQNVIDACLKNNVEIAMAVSSDKSVSPLNTYGATKLLMERIFTAANFYKGNRSTVFTSVRYGNVLGSRGSVVPQFLKSIKNTSTINITDPTMTRFNITLSAAMDLIINALQNARGGEVFVPKLNAYKLQDLAESIIELMNTEIKVLYSSIRLGEKKHEAMINEYEAPFTIESENRYILLTPELYEKNIGLYPSAKKNCLVGNYSSEFAPLIAKDKLKQIIQTELFDENNLFRPMFN
jgi:UDP-N-acetylglucosamine 4,6-dehydratase/UDP-glucose 4-epimerase